MASHLFFPDQAEGSLIVVQGRTIGLQYVGQVFSSPKYFFSRPSVAPGGGGELLISGGSNASWSSPLLRNKVEERSRLFSGDAEDMLMA